jgi:hypothetical protein
MISDLSNDVTMFDSTSYFHINTFVHSIAIVSTVLISVFLFKTMYGQTKKLKVLLHALVELLGSIAIELRLYCLVLTSFILVAMASSMAAMGLAKRVNATTFAFDAINCFLYL